MRDVVEKRGKRIKRARPCQNKTFEGILHDVSSEIQYGGQVKVDKSVVNKRIFEFCVLYNMALVAGMGVGVLLVLVFWTLGIIGCVALSRTSGPLK